MDRSPLPRQLPRALTRRAALAGLGGTLAVLTTATPARAVSTGGVSTLPLAGGRSLLSGLTTIPVPITTSGRMLGVTLPAGASGPVAVRVTRAGGLPGAWTSLTVDPGETATDPVWTGDLGTGAVVEVRLPAADAATAGLAVVDPGEDPTPTETATLLAASGLKPTIRSRKDWGADESLRSAEPAYADGLKAAIVHHTADGGGYDEGDVPAIIRGMYRYHTQTLGWSDLGYNVVVDRFGRIWEGRAGGTSKNVIGAHAGGFNTGTFGVSMMGDFTSVAPSDACLQAVAAVIAWKFSLHDLDPRGHATLISGGGGTARYPAGQSATIDAISGHRDVGYTACPGDVGYTRMDDIRSRVATLLAGSPKSSGTSAIARKYAAVDGEDLLGEATSGEGDALRGGRFRHYAKGSIYHHPDVGTFVVRGTHREKFASLGWEWSPLGFPTMDTLVFAAGTGSVTHFENGSIYRRTGAAPHVVLGAIRATWGQRGWENSSLGFPTSDEFDVPGGRASNFEGGQLRWNSSTGRVREVS
jgi:uncharacterized protein with LGFP repeats